MSDLSFLHNPDEHLFDDDQGLQAEQFFTDLALLRHQQAQLQSDAESAEFCELCGGEIPAERRRILPGVQLCVGCQSAAEIMEQRYGY